MKAFVQTLFRPLLGGAAALALGASALAPAAALADHDPSVDTTSATAVTHVAATLNGVVSGGGDLTVYTFQYGVTRYDHHTPLTALPPGGHGPRAVSAQVTGLTPATLYHYRLVAGDGRSPFGLSGGDQTFTTAPPPAPLPPALTPPTVAPAPPAPAAAPTPALGKTVVVAPVSGSVKVRAPGAGGFVALGAGGAVPTGATVDTRRGEVALTTALPNGTTQTAQFHGGVFRVRQSKKAGGTIDIDLRGPALACRSRSRSSGSAHARAAAATTKRRKLWGSDKGGRYRTHGRNSVATVRGTKWVTTDTCAGTRTTVTRGSVSVRDTRRKRTVLVRAGHTYVARAR